MAATTKTSSSVPHNHNNKNKHRYAVTTLVFLFLFLFSILLFTKRSLEPPISLYRDFFSQNQNQNQTQISSSFSSQEPPIYEPISPISPETINEEVSDKNEEHPLPKNGVSVENFGGKPISPISPKIINEEISDKNEEYPFSENVVSVENERLKECDLYNGSWVKDEENQYPIYKPGSCPYVDEAFDCQSNGRTDHHYLKWRWKPHSCDLPRFNATDFLARIRGKKLMLVGDSMNRNQFESILCLLREGLHNKSKMYEVHGHKITKGRGYYVFKFEDYNCTVDFVRSHFLVREGVRVNGQGNSNPTLSIDRIDKTSARWKRADILVFNTGHWWTHGKTARGKNYYREGDYVYPQFDSVEAYRRSLKTWANWIDKNVNPQKQLVFYRGFSSAHFRGGDWDSGGSCNGETEPAFTGAILNNYPLKMKIVEETIQDMRVPLKLLNVTRLTNFRKDGHPSIYGKNLTAGKKVSKRRQDCSHWCLPGVPDAWNELIYATLVLDQTSTVSNTQ